MEIRGLDHVVLTVADIDGTCAFYCDLLGMTRETFSGGRTALKFGTQKINLHTAGREFEPKAIRPTPGSGDICFLIDSVAEAKERLERSGNEVIEGPVERTGAVGRLLSIYCRDPDGNLIELAQRLE